MKISKPLISIVVPVFNRELYLKQSIESIINQTYKNLEIIVVDDGSTDTTSSICEFFSIKDKRIKVIHKANGGVSSARNIGIKVATGDAICFVDSDDTIENEYIEAMVSKWNEQKFELVICSIKDIYINKVNSRNINQKLSGKFFDDYYKLINFLRGPVAKLYKLSIIKENGIRFPETISRGEDQIFNFTYYRHVKNYCFVNRNLYNYYHRDISSLSNSYTDKNYQDNLIKLKLERDFFYSSNIRMKEKLINDSALRCLSSFSVNDIIVGYATFKRMCKEVTRYTDFNESGKSLKRYFIIICLKYQIILPIYIIMFLRFQYKSKVK